MPEAIAWDLDAEGPEQFLWTVEHRVPGFPFNHRHYDPDALRAIATDMGAQLRRIHSAALEK